MPAQFATIGYRKFAREEAALDLKDHLAGLGFEVRTVYDPTATDEYVTLRHLGKAGMSLSWKDAKALKSTTPADVIEFVRLTPEAIIPTRGSAQAAGMDLYTTEDRLFYTGESVLLSTGIAINRLPESTYARVAPRSGMGVKGFFVNAGVVDADYRGEVKVLLHYTGREPFQVSAGDRVAQLIVERYVAAHALEVESLGNTTRGAGGFGSTGS